MLPDLPDINKDPKITIKWKDEKNYNELSEQEKVERQMQEYGNGFAVPEVIPPKKKKDDEKKL